MRITVTCPTCSERNGKTHTLYMSSEIDHERHQENATRVALRAAREHVEAVWEVLREDHPVTVIGAKTTIIVSLEHTDFRIPNPVVEDAHEAALVEDLDWDHESALAEDHCRFIMRRDR